MSETKKRATERSKAKPATDEGSEPAQAVVIAYKGFEQDWTCRGFQYAIGGEYEHKGKVKACEGGFHACEDPLHVLRYYPASKSRFAVVEQFGTIARHDEDSKIASSRIRVQAEIGLTGLIQASIKFRMDRCTPAEGAVSDAPNTVAKAEGRNKSATASGYYGAATASGDYGAATASGYYGAATASGDSGAATASGNYGAATASGNYGAATASGDSGAATASGKNSAACAPGRFGRVRGIAGSALFLTRRDGDWNITHAWAGIVGKDGIEADVFYTLDENGKVVRA